MYCISDDFEKVILKKMTALSFQLQGMDDRLNEILHTVKQNYLTLGEPISLNYHFPIKTMEALNGFEDELNNETFFNTMVCMLNIFRYNIVIFANFHSPYLCLQIY